MTSQLTPDAPTLRETIEAVTTYYINPHPPASYHLCDGSPLNRNDYPELFNLIGTKYGGEGDHFQLPNTGYQIRHAGTGDYIKVKDTPLSPPHPIGYVHTFYFRHTQPLPQWYEPEIRK